MLVTAIRGDNEIKGISVGNAECKLSNDFLEVDLFTTKVGYAQY